MDRLETTRGDYEKSSFFSQTQTQNNQILTSRSVKPITEQQGRIMKWKKKINMFKKQMHKSSFPSLRARKLVSLTFDFSII
jgi:hypothetical protein